MTVLCVAAHPDDEVLGVGGTLAAHVEAGEEVYVCVLSNGVGSRHDSGSEDVDVEIKRREDAARESADTLGIAGLSLHGLPDNEFDSVSLLDIVQTIEEEIERYQPSIVYTHHYGDLNIDHELTCRATMTATRPLGNSPVERILSFETLSATEWSVPEPSNAFQPTAFVDISETLETKLDALEAYEEELRTHPHPRSIENVRRNAELWGAKSGLDVAEPFEVLREVVREL